MTGTGTEVGKTVVAAAIARTVAASGRRVGVFKPAVSGLGDDYEYPPAQPGSDDYEYLPSDHALLRRAAESTQTDDEIAPYRYEPAVSPHLGAELAGEPIEPARILEAARHARESSDFLVCEGVGGLLVPLTRDYLVRDLAADLELPLVIAASPGLGTINHTLLTLETARAAGLEARSIVMTPWPREPSPVERSNRDTISAIGSVPVQTLEQLDPSSPSNWPRLTLPGP